MLLLRWMCRLRMWRRLLFPCVTLIAVVLSLLHFIPHSSYEDPKSTFYMQMKNHSVSKTKMTTEYKTMPAIVGKLNVDMWTKTCSVNLNSIRQFPLFPLFPTKRLYIELKESFRFDIKEEFTAIRIMGYLHPPETGLYLFHLNSPVMSQFWVSTSSAPENTMNLAYTSSNIIEKQTIYNGDNKAVSDKITFQKNNKYYFEILLAVNDGLNVPRPLILLWMVPQASYFSQITGSHLSEYFNISSYYQTPDSPVVNSTLPSLQFCDTEDEAVGGYYPMDKERTEESKLPPFTLKQPHIETLLGSHLDNTLDVDKIVSPIFYMDMTNNSIVNSFSECTYNPAYTQGRKIKRYNGVWNTFFPTVFPNDGTNVARFSKPPRSYIDHIRGNQFLKEEDALNVVKNFMDQVNKQSPSNCSLLQVLNIELYNPKPINGEKYLLELLLQNRTDKNIYKFSGSFFRNKDKKDLCFLHNMQWNPKVWVNVILNVKNQPGWVLYFVQEMSRVLRVSQDKYVNFIIADYGNKGIDIEKEMKRYGIKSYQIFKQTGPFYKTSTINMAASKVVDPNSIVLLMDLHLQFPTNIFEVVRKHTIQGRTGFSPMLMRLLHCGRPKTKHLYSHGFYEPNGFGIFGIYKSDWDKFGGMNEKEFKNKWGGEDWEMVDRVLMKGYEIEKLRIPGFYHFDHDKVGMWN